MEHSSRVIQAHDGHHIFVQRWTPDGETRAILVISHGYGEHGGRYRHVAEFFASHGYLVCAPDHRSHGQSGGSQTFIRSFGDFLSDLDLVIVDTRSDAPGKPVSLLGHSMGGAIAVSYAIRKKPELRGLLLSGPAVVLGGDISPFMIKLAGFLGTVTPRLKTIKLDGDSVSRDPEVVARYNSDPLNYRGGIPARTGAELNREAQFIQANLDKLTLPCFLANGSCDKLVDPNVSKLIYDQCGSTDKTMKVYEGLYHEILNEPEKDQVMADMLGWMEARLSA